MAILTLFSQQLIETGTETMDIEEVSNPIGQFYLIDIRGTETHSNNILHTLFTCVGNMHKDRSHAGPQNKS